MSRHSQDPFKRPPPDVCTSQLAVEALLYSMPEPHRAHFFSELMEKFCPSCGTRKPWASCCMFEPTVNRYQHRK